MLTADRIISSKMNKYINERITDKLLQKNWTINVTRLVENETGEVDLGKSTLSKLTPGFYNSNKDLIISRKLKIISFVFTVKLFTVCK